MSNSLHARALIFDMDGTMIDNMMVHHRAWQRKLKSLGLDMTLEEVKRDVHGVNDEIIKRLFGNRFNDDEIAQIAWDKEAEYRAIYKSEVQLLPGLKNFLNQAKQAGIPMGIGTAAPKENAQFIIETLKLEAYFTTVIHSGKVSKGKPDPEVFELVAQNLNTPLNDCLIFEDSPTGAQAAENGKAQALILTTTHTRGEFKNITSIRGFLNDFKKCSIKKDNDSYKIALDI